MIQAQKHQIFYLKKMFIERFELTTSRVQSQSATITYDNNK
jgi:hypothetical protein